MNQTVILIRGLPGTGKSTLARMLVNLGFVHCEADDYFIDLVTGEYKFDGKRIKEAHEYCLNKFATALAAEESVVVANTFSRYLEMLQYLDEAKRYGIQANIINTAPFIYNNTHNVPERAIEAMRRRGNINRRYK